MKDTTFSANFTLNCQGNLRVYKQPIVMGIINATPDSFYENSRQNTVNDGLLKAEQMINEGAEVLDIGGYSSRPGAAEINTAEELNRVIPLITAIRAEFQDQLISIDSFRTEVAAEAIKSGANIINDISGGFGNPSMYTLAAEKSTPYIMMHMRGKPQNMALKTDYDLLLGNIYQYFSQQIKIAKSSGLKDIILDVGIGFSKTTDQNFELLKHLSSFKLLGHPILVGLSRKSLIYKSLDITSEQSLNGTTCLNTISLMNGANILRVHDVKEAKQVVDLFSKIEHS